MSDTIGWGILGTGGIAASFTSDIQGAGLHVAAVGSRSEEGASVFAERFSIAHAYGSYRDLVRAPEVDIVYVSTPHTFHAENAILALEAGKHVLVEKPFTINAAEAERVVALAAERGLLVLEAMWTRFLPMMVRIRELIADGRIGEVRTLLADHTQDLPKDPQHRLNNPALGGGALLDLGIYPVSFADDLFGEPTSIQAQASFTATGVDRQTGILLGYPEGQVAALYTALDSRGPNRATILGTAGRIEIDATWYTPTSFTLYDVAGEAVEQYVSEERFRGMEHQAVEAERLIREQATQSALLPPSTTVRIMRVLDVVRQRIGLRYPGEDGTPIIDG